MNEIILYHGSREGITGGIVPKSRPNCDFGSGFYMGENRLQTASLVADDAAPRVYTLRVALPPEDRILRLSERDWLYTVLACRRRIAEFDALPAAQAWRERITHFDLIIGRIADDRMNEAMQSFAQYALSDEGLYACLESVQYGDQYVARTEEMCRRIQIVDETEVNPRNFPELDNYMSARRQENRDVLKNIRVKYRGRGLYLDQIIQSGGGFLP